MAKRRIITRSSSYQAPTRTVQRRKDGKLTANQKWLNNLGKQGMFDWEVMIKYEDGRSVTKTLKFDTIDDARAWAYNKCQPDWTIFIDGDQVVSR